MYVCSSDIVVTKDVVFEKLSKLKPFKSPGLDGIYPFIYILKETAYVYVSRYVCYNQSITPIRSVGIRLEVYGNIISVFKKGSQI